MKFLIDTNIFIPLEPTRPSEVEGGTTKAAEFVQLAGISGHQLYVHPARREDLRRDMDMNGVKEWGQVCSWLISILLIMEIGGIHN